jgi:hypothetical protein
MLSSGFGSPAPMLLTASLIAFLFLLVKRSQELPFGGNLSDEDAAQLGQRWLSPHVTAPISLSAKSPRNQ